MLIGIPLLQHVDVALPAAIIEHRTGMQYVFVLCWDVRVYTKEAYNAGLFPERNNNTVAV